MSKKILILSVTVGNGHKRAAEALKSAARDHDPSIEVTILDTFRYASPVLDKFVFGTYMEMLKLSPALYAFLYSQSEPDNKLAGWGKNVSDQIINYFTAPKLIQYIREFQPDIIVCTHPFPVAVATNIREKGYFSGPIFVTITDFAIHNFWLSPGVDCYIVGAEPLCREGEAYGLLPERIQATGIPIDTAFGENFDRQELRSGFGLASDLPVILLTGGGLGLGHLESSVRALSEIGGCQLLVIAGANQELREHLDSLAPELPCPVQVYGFVNNIQHFMVAADLLIGKPGGLTCAEAMATQLPILMVDPLPGQEERNAGFFTGMGAGIQVSRQDLPEKVKSCLENPETLTNMTKAATALGKPNAARDAIRLMLD